MKITKCRPNAVLDAVRLMTCRKDAEISSVSSKLEGEQALVAQLQKKIKELQVCVPETSFCRIMKNYSG